MIEALGLVTPYFAIVAVGWVAAKRGVFAAAGLDGLNAFIFKIALPPMLFQVMLAAPEADAAIWPMIALYGGATLAIYALARLTARAVFGLRGGGDALYGHLAVNGNVGFLGLPLIAAALGPAAALPAAAALTFDLLVVMTITTFSLEAASSGGGALGRALSRAVLNPIVLAVFGGLAYGYVLEGQLGVSMPAPIATFLSVLGQAAAPAALFATGATLAHRELDSRVAELGSLIVWKLAIHPIAVAGAFLLIAPEQPLIWMAAAVLVAATPASNNAVIFAGAYRVYEARASATVLITTALSIATFAGFVAWLDAAP